jgi:hypothetical protein
MALAGLPHALAPRHAWSDARLVFLLMTGVAAALALTRWRAPPERRLTALQVLVLLPTGAPLLATGGDDVPVLALSLLALVLLDAGRPRGAVAAAGAAAALKLTGWPVLLAVLAVTRPASGRSGRAWAAWAIAGPLAVAFGAAAAGPASFIEDVVLFPLGLTASPTPANSQTLGRVLLSPLGDMPRDSAMRLGLTALLLAVAMLASARLLLRVRASELGQPGSAAALAAAGVSLVLIVLAPIGRSGYLIYPLDLAIWSALLRLPATGVRSGRPALVRMTDDRVELQPAG